MTDSDYELLHRILSESDGDNVSVESPRLSNLELTTDDFQAVERVVRFIEEHPDCDYGMPGPFVHFCERFPGCEYEQLVAATVRRNPNTHLLWMANRIKNSKLVEDQYSWNSLIESVAEQPSISNEIRSFARMLLG